MTLPRFAALALLLSACSDDASTSDAAPPDPCAPNVTFTGEFVDWDSTETSFLGIGFATFVLGTDTTVMDTTAPNGRFDLCIPKTADSLEVLPAAASEYVGGQVIVHQPALSSTLVQTYRSFKPSRGAAFGYDASKGQVFVHVVGGQRTVDVTTATIKQTFVDGIWTAGNTGTDIYLGNVSATSEVLSVSGGQFSGPVQIPVSPGQFTFVTVVAK
jgi:hypothetical protein